MNLEHIRSLYIESNKPIHVNNNNVQPMVIELTEDDVPGACLSEPLELHNTQELTWWLLCHGIKALTSWKKSNLISK